MGIRTELALDVRKTAPFPAKPQKQTAGAELTSWSSARRTPLVRRSPRGDIEEPKTEMQHQRIISKPENVHENLSCPCRCRCRHRRTSFRGAGFDSQKPRARAATRMVVQGARLCAQPLRALL